MFLVVSCNNLCLHGTPGHTGAACHLIVAIKSNLLAINGNLEEIHDTNVVWKQQVWMGHFCEGFIGTNL